MQLRKIKKASGGMGLLIALIAILVVGVLSMGGYYIYSDLTEPEPSTTTQQIVQQTATAQTKGDIVSYKLSCKDNSDNPSRYAGTAYCWNPSDPTSLKGGGSVTLSATASTSIPSITRDENFKCACFDSTHYGIITDLKADTESDDDTIFSKNASNTNTIQFYEDQQLESTNSITIAAGATDIYDKWTYKANVGDKGLNLKEVCFQSNNTNSEVSLIEMGGFSTSTVPYRLRNTHDFCFEIPSAKYIEDYATETFGGIKLTMSNSFLYDETLNMSIIDEAHYKSVDGSVKIGVQDDSPAPADVGTADASTTFVIVKG